MKLLTQLFRFGVTGVICFVIDFGTYMLCLKVFGINYLISGFIGFVVSTLVNYWLSTKFVFDVKVKSKAASAAWFFGLSASALVVHEAVLWFFATIICKDMYAVAKILTTGTVMVYNFITRKVILEKPFSKTNDNDKIVIDAPLRTAHEHAPAFPDGSPMPPEELQAETVAVERSEKQA